MTPERIEQLATAISEERERRRVERRTAPDYHPHFIWIENGQDAGAAYRAALANPELKGFDIELIGWPPWDPAEVAEWEEQIEKIKAAEAAAALNQPMTENSTAVENVERPPRKPAVKEPAASEPAGPQVRWRRQLRHWMSM